MTDIRNMASRDHSLLAAAALAAACAVGVGLMTGGCSRNTADGPSTAPTPATAAMNSAPSAPSYGQSAQAPGYNPEIADRYRFYAANGGQIPPGVDISGGAGGAQTGNSTTNNEIADRYRFYSAHTGQQLPAGATQATPAAH